LLTKIKSLSAGQGAAIEGHRRRWAQLRVSTAPANRELAEAGIGAAYRAAGRPAPRQIVWCSSPIQMSALWAKTTPEKAGPNLRTAIAEQIRSVVAFSIQRRIHGSVLATVDELSQRIPAGSPSETIREAVVRSCNVLRPLGSQRNRWLFWLDRGRPWLNLQDAGFSARGLPWLDRHDFFRTAFELQEETEPLEGLLQIAANADWIIPHKHICWISEPPQVLVTDAGGRMHNASGPALQYRDGWSAYAWKGVEVPWRVIERPEYITLADIDRTSDIHVRRCMIDRLTPERYIASGAAFRVSEDDTGVLWERRWPDGDAWAAVEVINGTAERNGIRKRYFLQVPPNMLTARSAVAWTYGMTARQYRGLLRRT
jgi:hypothetical protein